MENQEAFYFECKQKDSNKFWAVEVVAKKGTTYLIRRYGKIGQTGRSMVEEFPYRSFALRRREKLIDEKIQKGYKPVM